MQWERSVLELEETLGGVEFRHKIPFVPVSSIAEQYYCELKVEHEYTQGEVPSEAKEEGTVLHEQFLEMEETTRANLIQQLKDRHVSVASFLIGAKVSGLTIAGLPDAVVFLKGVPAFLVELKTSKGELVLWKDQEVQAKTYALLLDAMGFDCSSLQIVVVKIRRSRELQPEMKKEFLRTLVKLLLGKSPVPEQLGVVPSGESRIFTLAYKREDILRDLEWVKQYWLGNRDPIPTNQAGKCRACEFNEICPASLVA